MNNLCKKMLYITVSEFHTTIVLVPNKSTQNNKPAISGMLHPLCFCYHFKSWCTKSTKNIHSYHNDCTNVQNAKMMETRILAKPQNWNRISNIGRECTSSLLNSFTLILGNINNRSVGGTLRKLQGIDSNHFYYIKVY